MKQKAKHVVLRQQDEYPAYMVHINYLAKAINDDAELSEFQEVVVLKEIKEWIQGKVTFLALATYINSCR